MTIEIPVWINEVYYATVNFLALSLGGRDERGTGAALLVRQVIAFYALDRTWPHVQWALFGLDVATLALFLVLALRSTKFWPLFLCGFLLLSVGTHLAKLLDGYTHQWAYVTTLLIWTYAQTAALGAGVWNHARSHPGHGVAHRFLALARERLKRGLLPA